MSVYVAWTGEPLPDDLVGPWHEVWVAAEQLAFIDSDDTLSRVYHEVKWSLPDGTALAVSPLVSRPKLKGLRPGTQNWLRDRIA